MNINDGNMEIVFSPGGQSKAPGEIPKYLKLGHFFVSNPPFESNMNISRFQNWISIHPLDVEFLHIKFSPGGAYKYSPILGEAKMGGPPGPRGDY